MGSKMKKWLLILILVLLNNSISFAGRVWQLHTLQSPYGFMAMKSDGTWPIISTQSTLYTMGSTGFSELAMTSAVGYGNVRISSDGQIAIMKSNPINNSSSLKLFKNGKWSTLPATKGAFSVASIDFDSNNNLNAALVSLSARKISYGVYTGVSWATQDTGLSCIRNLKVDLKIDSFDIASIACDTGYSTQNPISKNMWITRIAPKQHISMDVSNSGIPAIVYAKNSAIYLEYFDIQSQQWQESFISSASTSYAYADIKYDNLGNIGVAFSDGEKLAFAYNDGTGWSISNIMEGTSSPYLVSLDYDNQNNPVACFSNNTQTILAYDPIVIPEPSSLILICAGIIGFIKKRSQAE